MDDALEVRIEVRETVKVRIEPREVLWAINDLPISQKWGAVSTILDGINLDEPLTEPQTEIVKKWLKKQTDRFNQ